MKKIAALLLLCITLCSCSNGSEFETSSTDILSQTGENVGDDKNGTSATLEPNDTSATLEPLDEIDSSDYPTLRIGMCYGQNTKKQIPLLNQKLHANGCKVNVEAVDFSQYFTIEYSGKYGYADVAEAIKKCEEEKGPLDIIIFIEFIGKRGTIYKLVSDGYLEPLDYKNTVLYGLVPEKLWETAKVNGKVYAFPSWTSISGDYVYFNKDYVSEEDINSFDGTTEKLIEIASKIPKEDDLRRISFSLTNYRDGSIGICDEYDIQEGLILDYETMKAYNPFEYEPFIQELRKRNLMYSFADGYFEKSSEEKIVTKEAIVLTESKFSEAELEAQNLFAYCINPARYLTNSLNTGIIAKSQHKEEALQFLNEITSGDYSEFSDIGTSLMYFKEKQEELNNSEIKISPFAGYMMYCKDVEDYDNIEQACYDFYEELIKAPNFDEKLTQVQQQLKEMGIDDYVEKVNEILSEKMQYDS